MSICGRVRLYSRLAPSSSSRAAPNPALTQHLNGLFPDIPFNPLLAAHVLTHSSHPTAIYGHNARFSFLGRRALEFSLQLFLASSKNLRPTDDINIIVTRTLNRYLLGEHVGSPWGLGRVIRWTPSLPAASLRKNRDQTFLLKSVGLYKVQGEAVGAIVGAVYQHFGASVAHRLFHTRILPRILLGAREQGLPQSFHHEARLICNSMGGLQGPLLSSTSAVSFALSDAVNVSSHHQLSSKKVSHHANQSNFKVAVG